MAVVMFFVFHFSVFTFLSCFLLLQFNGFFRRLEALELFFSKKKNYYLTTVFFGLFFVFSLVSGFGIKSLSLSLSLNFTYLGSSKVILRQS